LAESASVVGFEATDDTRIKWLDPRRKIWFEEDQLDVCWLVGDIVARKVVEVKANFPLLLSHHVIKHLKPSVIS